MATMWFLWGIVAISGIVGYNAIDQSTSPSIAFVTQQFLTTSPFGVKPNPANPINPVNLANPANPVNPVNPVNPANPANPVNPVAAALFGKWNFLFQMIMTNPNPPASPICKVKWIVTTIMQPGVIHFEAQPDPANASIRCGLMDLSTNLLVDLAPTNVISFDFVNIPEGKYDVVCLVWKPAVVNIMNSFNFCSDGTFIIAATWTNNPPTSGAAVVDLELYGHAVMNPNWNNPTQPSSLLYQFKIHNNPINATIASSQFQLRIYPQWLVNISWAIQSGSMYFVDLWLLNPGEGTGFALEWVVDPMGSGPASAVAELCNYSNDVDSQPCNMVNLTPTQDDEVKL